MAALPRQQQLEHFLSARGCVSRDGRQLSCGLGPVPLHSSSPPGPGLPVTAAGWLKRYLPGVAAPPTGLGGDAQTLAAGLVGHERELAHGAASKSVEGAGQGHAHGGCPDDQEQKEGTVHPGKSIKIKCHLFDDLRGEDTH